MLRLTRRKGEAIDLTHRDTGDVIGRITVLERLPNGLVELGLECEPWVRITRDGMRNTRDPGKETATDDSNEPNGNR
jgi:hypothetical protein